MMKKICMISFVLHFAAAGSGCASGNDKKAAEAAPAKVYTRSMFPFRRTIPIFAFVQGSPPTAVGTRSKGNSCENQGLFP